MHFIDKYITELSTTHGLVNNIAEIIIQFGL